MTTLLNARMLLASGIIAAVAALALGATYAAWQASSSIAGNTVSTANLTITAIGASGSTGNPADPKPINWTNARPGQVSTPEDRATVTNGSSVALDLHFYLEIASSSDAGACAATNVAYQSSVAGGGPVLVGYPAGPTPNVPGTIGAGGSFNFTPVNNLVGVSNAKKIADDSQFGLGAVIAVREIAGLASDAAYPANAGTCVWTEHFIGTLPDVAPVAI